MLFIRLSINCSQNYIMKVNFIYVPPTSIYNLPTFTKRRNLNVLPIIIRGSTYIIGQRMVSNKYSFLFWRIDRAMQVVHKFAAIVLQPGYLHNRLCRDVNRNRNFLHVCIPCFIRGQIEDTLLM